MRPPRVVIVVAFFLTTVFLTFLSLRSSHPRRNVATTGRPQTTIQSFFSVRAPFSLFPPNAAITLTHENSTSFLARPAAFGPVLPTEGLKGQVWIGSGFGDDAGGIEGELGCSDVPGWVDSYAESRAAVPEGVKSGDSKAGPISTKFNMRRGEGSGSFEGSTAARGTEFDAKKHGAEPSAEDGTDDYLHHPLPASTVIKTTNLQSVDSSSHHADIQSIQEGAEIAEKVVLLSRGGCGFLEKVKWAQRRGAIALIVGDDVKGGPLIQMYARGDTSNVTIPSIFTSRTTAHLLSTLVGPGSFLEDFANENGKPSLKVHTINKHAKGKKKQKQNSSPTFTPTTSAIRATMTARAASRASSKKLSTSTNDNSAPPLTTERPGWLSSLFFGASSGKSRPDSSRPPSSGQLDWVLVDDWKDDDSSGTKKISKVKSDKKSDGKKQKNKGGDDFVIGVQDWRDPDLVGSKDSETGPAKAGGRSDATKTNNGPRPTKSGKKQTGGALQYIPEYIPPLRGGSITPGSGEYGAKVFVEQDKVSVKVEDGDAAGRSKGLLTAIFGDDEENLGFPMSGSTHEPKIEAPEPTKEDENDGDEYEGLWVTLTPTSGASPFLDTLLVLVVSPLVTLTVVYALLLIRSRIRRRRWRAPKSVVERLPVRTYQTIAATGTQSPRLPSPTSSSATTPLLQNATPTRPRPRSRTTSGIPELGDHARVISPPLQVPSLPPSRIHEHEKNASVSTEWKKYMGKQIECVVCLEEYVDGISRVMSLPCGHEFHVDCITPWLTTRRRTCPICKGDVVRSLARGSPSSPRYEPYHDESDDDIQIQAAEIVNESSSSALPIPSNHSVNETSDLEQGVDPRSPTRNRRMNQASNWREILSNSISSSFRSIRPPQEDRDR